MLLIDLCLQELALKTFKKKYLPGDPSKLQEYEVADTALSEVSITAAPDV